MCKCDNSTYVRVGRAHFARSLRRWRPDATLARRIPGKLIPVTVHTHISASREEIYDYLVDLAGRVAFTDHYLEKYHLTSPRSSGQGAGARFRMRGQWAEIVIVEAVRPRRIAEEGGLGRLGRTRLYSEYELSRAGEGFTRVELRIGTEPGGRSGPGEGFRARRWYRRQSKVALERLRKVFEEQREGPLARAAVAGYEPSKAPRFGVSPHYERPSPAASASETAG